MEILSQVMEILLNPYTILLIVLGTTGGIFMGAMPGLNGPIGVAILLPFTFGLDPISGLLMLGGIYMGSNYGGSISAVLLNCPGTGAAACTAIDGYAMAKKGKAKEALYYSIWASVFGGFVGVGILIFFTPLLAKFALKFGPSEMFLVAIAGLTVVGGLSGRNFTKGMFAVALGLFVSMVGTDTITGTYRLTFSIEELRGGIPLISVVVGLFAISEMLIQSTNKTGKLIDVPLENAPLYSVFKRIITKYKVLIKSSILGTIIGILPGAGGAVATFICYGESKRTSKEKELYGEGSIEGIVASESGNNAAVGGSLVPLLALGIPGSATAAVLYGALTIHGLIPGPRLFSEHPQIAYSFIVGMLATVIVMGVVGTFGVNIFSKILKVKLYHIVPIVLVFCMFGSYSVRNNLFDVLMMIIFGVIGLFMRKFGIPVAPVVLGVILGPLAEQNFRRSLTIARSQDISILNYIFVRPISIFIVVFIFVLMYANYKTIAASKNEKESMNKR